MKKIIFPALTAIALLAFQNCSDVSFKNVSNVNGKSCRGVLETTTQNLRIIFMVDDSGSTLDTDPMKNYRALAAREFINKYGSKANFAYMFGYFASSNSFFYNYQSDSFTNANTSVDNTVGNASELSEALDKYLDRNINKNANTPYDSAFNALNKAILADISATDGMAKKPNYAIVFMSDGEPNPDRTNDEVKALVKNLKSAVLNKARLVTVSTVYFGPRNKNSAINKLKNMADEGNGQFVNTNDSSDLTIDDVISVPGEICL